jgi:hypothetical protein
MSQKHILFVFTSADKLLDGTPTGWYLPEGMRRCRSCSCIDDLTDCRTAAHAFYVLRDHAVIDFAAPKGPNPPVDAGSVEVSGSVHGFIYPN